MRVRLLLVVKDSCCVMHCNVCCVDYDKLLDVDLIKLIIDGNDEAAIYLLYQRYIVDIRYHMWRKFDSCSQLDELITDLYIYLKGAKMDWQTLRSYNARSSFRTWFNTVIEHFMLKKKLEKDRIENAANSISLERLSHNLVEQSDVQVDNPIMLMTLEAIQRLKNDDYRFVLIKELMGYNHKEIAAMLAQKRRMENRHSTYRGNEVIPDAHYVDMLKGRALREVKIIVQHIKSEWYGN